MLKKLIFIVFLFFTHTLHADSIPTYVKDNVENAAIVGKGNLSKLIWNVYDATLYAPSGNYNSKPPYALSLDYNMDIDGKDIAERSLDEIQKQGYKGNKGQIWLQQMTNIFPNVDENTRLTAICTTNGTTLFYKNTTKIGEVKDKDFCSYFFGIWLAQNTSEPDLRKSLLKQ
jgi:hypothetical protein